LGGKGSGFLKRITKLDILGKNSGKKRAKGEKEGKENLRNMTWERGKGANKKKPGGIVLGENRAEVAGGKEKPGRAGE